MNTFLLKGDLFSKSFFMFALKSFPSGILVASFSLSFCWLLTESTYYKRVNMEGGTLSSVLVARICLSARCLNLLCESLRPNFFGLSSSIVWFLSA